MKRWTWRTNLDALMGKSLIIETTDGIYLRGILTGTKHKTFMFDEREVNHITAIMLDNDPEKEADVMMLKEVKVQVD